jgi:hypothetical protein
VDALIQSGYPYELAGLLYYVFFLTMTRGKNAARFSQRSKVLTLAAAIALIGSVPLHYAARPPAVVAMLALVAVAMASTWLDRRRPEPPAAPKVGRGKRQPKAQTSSRLPSGSSKKQA